jgi:hypothetical protein
MCLGGADCVWADVLAWEEMYGREWDGVVIAANDVGAHWPRDLHHWVTLHGNKMPKWRALRLRQQLPQTPFKTWGRAMRMSAQESQDTDAVIRPWSGGSSGMLAAQVAAEIGCTRAVLCGIPMTQTAHFSETHEHFHSQWLAANGHWRGWTRAQDKMHGWCRSMSGRTRELLGAPTLEWLLEADTLV